MRTTLDIDPKLLDIAAELTGESNKGRVVNAALEELVRRRRLEELRAMAGKLDIDLDDFDAFRHSERT